LASLRVLDPAAASSINTSQSVMHQIDRLFATTFCFLHTRIERFKIEVYLVKLGKG
jgi:hypothetical protein